MAPRLGRDVRASGEAPLTQDCVRGSPPSGRLPSPTGVTARPGPWLLPDAEVPWHHRDATHLHNRRRTCHARRQREESPSSRWGGGVHSTRVWGAVHSTGVWGGPQCTPTRASTQVWGATHRESRNATDHTRLTTTGCFHTVLPPDPLSKS